MKQEEKERLLKACFTSTEKCARILFPENFTRPFSAPHYKMFNWFDAQYRKKVCAAPRGVGKTSLACVNASSRLLSGRSHYLVYIGASLESALEQTENLKQELTTNENIIALFGDLKTDTFAKEKWDINIFGQRARILPIGPGKKIRGRKLGHVRPDLIVCDDMENDESVESEDQRTKLWRWLHSAVFNSVDRAKWWEVLIIGTILHSDSALARFLDPLRTSGWLRLSISLCDNMFNSNFPEFISTEEVKKIAEEYRQIGEMSVFAREFMNQPVAEEDQAFKPYMFQAYDEELTNLNSDPDVVNVVLIDPAKTVSQGSCATAIVCVGVNITNPMLYVRDVRTMKVTPHELYEQALAMCTIYNAKVLAVEVTSLHEFILQPLKSYLARERRYDITIFEAKPRDKKEKRAGALLPYYKRGLVKHAKDRCAILELRLQQWPRPSTWDELDAYAHIIPVMEEGELYFESAAQISLEEQYEILRREDEAMEPLPMPIY